VGAVRNWLVRYNPFIVTVAAIALIAIPVYVLVATAGFAQRPWTDLAATVPVVRDSNLGRSFGDLDRLSHSQRISKEGRCPGCASGPEPFSPNPRPPKAATRLTVRPKVKVKENC